MESGGFCAGVAPVSALLLGSYIARFRVDALPACAALLSLWLTSPAIAWWLSRPLPSGAPHLSQDDTEFLEELSASLRQDRILSRAAPALEWARGVAMVACVWLGARSVLDGSMSLGALVAFLSVLATFLGIPAAITFDSETVSRLEF